MMLAQPFAALRSTLALSVVCALFCFWAPATYAHPGWGIAINSKGEIYFPDIDNLTIWKLLPDGSLHAAVTNVWTHHLFLDAHDNLYYEREESRGNSFWRLSPSGEQTLLIPPTPNVNEYWGEHTYIDAAGNIYFPGRWGLQKRSPDGTVAYLAGAENQPFQDGQGSQAGFDFVTAFSWGPDSTFYVIDTAFADPAHAALRKVTLDGTVTTLARGLLTVPPDDPFFANGSFNRIWHLSVDDDGTAYVAYHGNRRLLKVSPEGVVSELYHAQAPWSPVGVTVNNGILYILETAFREGIGHSGPRIRRLAPDGTSILLVTIGEGNTKGEVDPPEHTFDLETYPNPFRDQTTISYDLPAPGHTHLTLYDNTGRAVKELVHAFQNVGSHQISWDGTDSAGRRVSSGVYHCRLEAGGRIQSISLVLMK